MDSHSSSAKRRFWPLSIGAIGVVYGDIGTSPLYALHEALGQAAGGGLGRDDVLGVVSLALWALVLVVTVKYVLFLMRADNDGEGGVLSLSALAERAVGGRTLVILCLSLAGAALFYGDAVITPAISVLSAVEGLRSVPALAPHVSEAVVLEITLVILVALFMVQSRGTSKVARVFGPVCILWFAAISVLGVMQIPHRPDVLLALSPTYGGLLLVHHGVAGLLVLGSVFLTVTGAEALYADMGHFGRWPIQASWLFLVLPSLVLNYLGQGALALHALAGGHAFANQDWFFMLAPEALRIPMVILAALATVIASQAVITGAFSLSHQAMQLGLLPRLELRRTSATEAGQIYMPQINMMLLVGVIFLVVVFKTSSNLAQAYGLAVTGTMVVTTSLAMIVVRRLWKWSLPMTALVVGPLLAVDLVFLGANSLKIASGGWLPLSIGAAIILVMATWVRGSSILAEKTRRDALPLDMFVERMRQKAPHRITGTAVFLIPESGMTPTALLHNLKHNGVLHERNVIVSVHTAQTPRVEPEERMTVQALDAGFWRVALTFGFMEEPDVPEALKGAQPLDLDAVATSFFLGRRSLVMSPASRFGRWRQRLYLFLARNATNPSDTFRIPAGRVVEMGAQVSL